MPSLTYLFLKIGWRRSIPPGDFFFAWSAARRRLIGQVGAGMLRLVVDTFANPPATRKLSLPNS